MAQLEGLVVTADLAEGGCWSGTVDGRGRVVIELGSALAIEDGMPARFSVEAVLSAAAGFVRPGTALGELAGTATTRR